MGERFLAFIDVLGFKYIVEKTDKASHIMNTLEEVKRKTEKLHGLKKRKQRILGWI